LRRQRPELEIVDGVEATRGWILAAKQCAKDPDGLVQALPTLLIVDADGAVVSSGRTWSHTDPQPAARQQVERSEALGQRNRATDDR
jgi:hypothetical protein